MVNQLIFGEQYTVETEEEKWVEVKSIHDGYRGWIDQKQHNTLINDSKKVSVLYNEGSVNHKSRGKIIIPPGCLIPEEDILSKMGFSELNYSKQEPSLIQACLKFINAPYLWGGRTPYGIDCSGFTQLVYRMIGISLPRDASQQVDLGDVVSFISQSKEGDLAFFDNAERKITHVGIILDKEEKQIIHASGRVRIDKIDHNGIYNEDTNSYSHQLRTIKTIL